MRAALADYDLLIVAGADVLRMSVWNETDPLPSDMPLIHIGQIDWEMGKNYPAEIALRADLKATLQALIPSLETKGGETLKAKASSRLAAIEGRNWLGQTGRKAEGRC